MKYGVTALYIVTIAVICIVWWVNGAELEDAWLYVFGISLVLIPALETYFKRKK